MNLDFLPAAPGEHWVTERNYFFIDNIILYQPDDIANNRYILMAVSKPISLPSQSFKFNSISDFLNAKTIESSLEADIGRLCDHKK